MSDTRILVVDGNASWVRSLFLAMPAGVKVGLVRAYHPGFFKKALGKSMWAGVRAGRSQIRDGVWDEYVMVPGWTRFNKVSEFLLKSRVKKAIRKLGGVDAVVYTLPQYAGVAEKVRRVPTIYYAYDPYEFYEWNKDVTRTTEDRLLKICDVSVAISRRLEEDFQQRDVGGTLAYSPNAVSDSFVAAMRGKLEVPADLVEIKSAGRSIIGCTGQINGTYDWDLIEALAHRLPEATFVFVGNLAEDKPEVRARIEACFTRPNVKWLGPKDHATLPTYIANFDICYNPLKVTAHNDRRSPLRLYDYLATHRPILSTAVAEAGVHGDLLNVGRDADECAVLIGRMLSPGFAVDGSARDAYIARNTWSARARGFLELVSRARARAAR